MEVRIIEGKTIYGISTRTNNASEMSPSGKIPALWQKFDAQVAVDYQGGERVYGVYTDYASDQDGDFTVTAGYDAKNSQDKAKLDDALHAITIPTGRYLVFSKQGEMPQIAIDAWTEVWHFFKDEAFQGDKNRENSANQYQRTYSTDFEYYPNANEIQVCIAIAEDV